MQLRIVIFLLTLIAHCACVAQTVSPSSTAVPTTAALLTSEIAPRAEEAMLAAEDAERTLVDLPLMTRLTEQLQSAQEVISAEWVETNRILSDTTTSDTINDLEKEWEKEEPTLSLSNETLHAQARKIESAVSEFEKSELIWRETLTEQKRIVAASVTTQRIQSILERLQNVRLTLRNYGDKIVSLQLKYEAQLARIGEARRQIEQQRSRVTTAMTSKDSLPWWSMSAQPTNTVSPSALYSLEPQYIALKKFFEQEPLPVGLLIPLFGVFLAAINWIRRSILATHEVHLDPATKDALTVISQKYATAFLLSIVSADILLPGAPRLFWALISFAAIFPVLSLIRYVSPRPIFIVSIAMISFYSLDRLRMATIATPVVARISHVVEILLAAMCLYGVAYFQKLRWSDRFNQERWRAVLIYGVQIALGTFVFITVADLLGYARLSIAISELLLKAAYGAIAFYALDKMLRSFVVLAIRWNQTHRFRVVRSKQEFLVTTLSKGLTVVLTLGWIAFTVSSAPFYEALIQYLQAALQRTIGYGTITFSIGDIITFIISILGAIYFSRFIRFILEEEVYPRTQLSRGLPYAISRVVHYTILVVGFFLGVGALGVDMTKFTILAGAFGVGLGFGLQNILNNFFSGLIVLFERPVRVGDVIQMGDVEGVVERIGIRASFIKTARGSEIILPNAKLISEQVTNWTFSSLLRAIDIAVTVGVESDPKTVIALLQKLACDHPAIDKESDPQVTVTKFGPDSITYELRAFTTKYIEWEKTKSDLTLTAHAKFIEQSIVIK